MIVFFYKVIYIFVNRVWGVNKFLVCLCEQCVWVGVLNVSFWRVL